MNREFLFDLPQARDEYLARASKAFARTDWVPLGYALMSSHVHWLARAGSCSSDQLIRSLHAGFARWLNWSTGRLGPVFADRHRNVECAGRTALAMLAYVHNNPVRAGVVSDARASSWTSHRAYVGLEPSPPWLNVELGLELSGLEPTYEGRIAFHDVVAARSRELRRPDLSGANLQQVMNAERRSHALPVGIESPIVVGTKIGLVQRIDCVVPANCPPRPTWRGSPLLVIAAVALFTGIPESEIRSRVRTHRISAARRYALLVWVHQLARPVIDMAQALGISSEAASNHLARSTLEERAIALRCLSVAVDGSLGQEAM